MPPETLLTSRRWPNDPVVSKASPLSDPVRLAKDPESSPEALTRVIPIGTWGVPTLVGVLVLVFLAGLGVQAFRRLAK
ncbi:MAG: hypothetical protein AUI15_14105 [Actinobacteria bacterium 13_2_20CM_2_66_6]|nr:MAG: hypothetical protein AUI15_14105 [Actinobacteria bacterium 13_2_20CM_2_66_6]